MADEADQKSAERELMHMNGQMAALTDQIADLEARDERDAHEERRQP